MAELAASAVASAVIDGITDRAFTTVMRKLRCRPAAAHEKLQRLETAVLKLRCAVEVSEKHAIESASLLEWRDNLREASAEGGAVVLDFQRRAREGGGEAASTSASTSTLGQQQPGGSGGGGATATAGALYFTRSALYGMAQRVRDATRRLFSTDEDMKKLDGALEKMERLSPDITQFLIALQLEVVVPELGRQTAKRREPASDKNFVRGPKFKRTCKSGVCVEEPIPPPPIPRCFDVESGHPLWDSERRPRKEVTSEIMRLASAAEAREDRKEEATILASVLHPKLRRMDCCIKATDDRDMEGLEWLAEWAAVLREAVERGNAVLEALCPGSDVIHNASGGALEVDGELYIFASAVERLATEEPCFTVLVDLCPREKIVLRSL